MRFPQLWAAVLVLGWLALAQSNRPAPASGVADFEATRFCRQYSCLLNTIEPQRIGGALSGYFYDYGAFLPNGREHPAHFGFRLTPAGKREEPYLLVRWFPVNTFSAA